MKISKSKSITFTPTMRAKGLLAFTSGATAAAAKGEFFKAIKSRVAVKEDVDAAKGEFRGIAMHYYAGLHGEEILAELANPTLKNAQKLKGCKLTMKAIKDGIDTMSRRWIASYKRYLKTGIVVRAGGKAGAKRATKGAVKPQPDKAVPEAPDTTPLKRAIEFLTTIPRTVLKDTKPSQCSEALRTEIEFNIAGLLDLLAKIK
tara:strand:- start:223 stop:831 length:609 start_codon:yes stop_codon:yes gene_type:complete